MRAGLGLIPGPGLSSCDFLRGDRAVRARESPAGLGLHTPRDDLEADRLPLRIRKD